MSIIPRPAICPSSRALSPPRGRCPQRLAIASWCKRQDAAAAAAAAKAAAARLAGGDQGRFTWRRDPVADAFGTAILAGVVTYAAFAGRWFGDGGRDLLGELKVDLQVG
jgi:hypothetical protein